MTVAEMTETRFSKREHSPPLENACATPSSARPLVAPFPGKHFIDRLIAAVLLVPALPLIFVLAAIIRLTSKGPGIFRQLRVGQKGRIFTMYKLRSMRPDAEAATGPAWSANAQDPRVTRLGFWLRRLHLDELPQLINVLRGEMSLVGPRPERPEFVHVLADQIPGYLDRLVVRPGITGLAQINLPPDTDIESVRSKLAVDLDYIAAANFWLDLRIMACTALRVLWIRGPWVTRMLGVKRTVFLSPACHRHGEAPPVRVTELLERARPAPNHSPAEIQA